MDIKGIDVSAYNGTIDYAKVAEAGIKTAVLRITERGNVIDPAFENNYRGFREHKIRAGVYKYSYALDEEEAREEARRVLEVLDKRPLQLPVFYDMEWAVQRELSRDAVTEIIKAFRREIVDGGYLFGIYCNTDWYYNVLDTASLPYDYWLASYPYDDRGVLVESLRPPVGIGWQYSSRGRVPGISGNTDLDVFYRDFPERPEESREEECILWVGKCTGNGVRVRRGPGLEYTPIEEYPYLNKGNLVDVIGVEKADDGTPWFKVWIARKYKGWVRYDYIDRA